MFMHKGIPRDIRRIIEAKVRLGDVTKSLLVRYMSGLGKKHIYEKQKAKRLEVCHKCAR